MGTWHPPAAAGTVVLSLFDECPLHGCRNPVDDPRWPCQECETALAGYIRPASRQVTAEQVRDELAEGAARAAAVMAARRRLARQGEQCPW